MREWGTNGDSRPKNAEPGDYAAAMKHFSHSGRTSWCRSGAVLRSGAALGLATIMIAALPYSADARKKQKVAEPVKEEVVDPSAQAGALTIIISLKNQSVQLYRADKLVDSSRVSSGRRGYSTPGGVFSVLQKNKWHRSNLYHGASMPYMQRLTWSGVALHAGVLPGYPASHGCIRLTHAFAKKIWGMTHMGQHVVVAYGEAPQPVAIEHAALFQPSEAPKLSAADKPEEQAAEDKEIQIVAGAVGAPEPAPEAEIDGPEAEAGAIEPIGEAGQASPDMSAKAEPESTGPLRILITQRTGREKLRDAQKMLYDMGYIENAADGALGPETVKGIKVFQVHKGMTEDGIFDDELIARMYQAADRGEPSNGHLYVRQDMKPVYDAPVDIKDGDAPLGTHLFVSSLYKPGQPEHKKIEWVAITPEVGPAASAALDRIEISNEVRQKVAALMQPGSSVLVDDNGISNETTPKGTDFVALTKRNKVAAKPKNGEVALNTDVEAEADEARPVRKKPRRRVQRRPRPRHYADQGGFFGGRLNYYEEPTRYEPRRRRPARRVYREPIYPWSW